jgi:acyl-CoA thioester hydrolase
MNLDEDKYKASFNIEIKTYEIDAAGHVNNIVYIKWLEDLRCKLFEQILPIDTLLCRDLYPAVISTNITYKKQVKLSDRLAGFIWVENIRHNIMTLKFNFISSGNICAFAEQKCVIMNLEKGTMDKKRLNLLTELE